jgi:L-lactate dehydrogenase complex protein LldG
VNDDARREVFSRMRRALRRGEDGEAKAAVEARLARPAPTLVPARVRGDHEDRVRLFIEQAEAVQTHVERIGAFADLPATIAAYLRRHNLPQRLAMATDPKLVRADWTGGLIETRRGAPAADDPVGLTVAYAGIAETGTLMLASDADRPTTLAFLPETAIVVLAADRIARAYEDALHAFRASAPNLPRSINLVTGPSRSGDIEQTLQLGAHGPKRLLVVLIDEPSGLGPIPDVPPLSPEP